MPALSVVTEAYDAAFRTLCHELAKDGFVVRRTSS